MAAVPAAKIFKTISKPVSGLLLLGTKVKRGYCFFAGVVAQLVLLIGTGGALHVSELYFLCTYVWVRTWSREGK